MLNPIVSHNHDPYQLSSHQHHHEHGSHHHHSMLHHQSSSTGHTNMLFNHHAQLPQTMIPGFAGIQQPLVSPIVPTHICHWKNCHLTFHSMPDLLGHVASDHLGAPGFTAPQPAPVLPVLPAVIPTPEFTSTGSMSQVLVPPNTMYTPAEADQLLSCLWDDCFPLPECTAPAPETCPTHSHMPTHPMAASHTHNPLLEPLTHVTGSGEPFSPQTMLRHVLEEHLGVPGEIIGWAENDPPPILPPTTQESVIQAHTKLHNNHHVHDHQHTHGHGHHHHHHHHLLTPSPSNPTISIPASPNPKQNPTFPTQCLWTGCNHSKSDYTPEDLMAHLTTIHVPHKSTLQHYNPASTPNSHTCLWDGCDRPFTSRQKLIRHLQSHIGYKPFLCHICGVGFGEAVPLAAHLRRHAKESEYEFSGGS
jgi:hypothetical protein